MPSSIDGRPPSPIPHLWNQGHRNASLATGRVTGLECVQFFMDKSGIYGLPQLEFACKMNILANEYPRETVGAEGDFKRTEGNPENGSHFEQLKSERDFWELGA